MADTANWAKLTVKNLKAELIDRGLPTTGLKAVLVNRLEEDDSTNALTNKLSRSLSATEAATPETTGVQTTPQAQGTVVPSPPAPPTSTSSWTWLLPLLLVLMVVAALNFEALAAAGTSAKALVMDGLKASEEYARNVGHANVLGFRIPLGPIVIMGIYVVSCVLLLPLFGIHSVAGYLYGTIPGALLVTASQTLGASCCFYLARWVAGKWIRPWLDRKWGKKYHAIEAAIEEDAFKIVLMMRLSPVVPFSLTNYVAGCSKVPIGKFALGTWLGIMPGTTFYVGMGHVMRMVEEGEFTEDDKDGFGQYKGYLVGFGLLVTLKLLHLASQRATKVLEDAGFQDEIKEE